MLKTYSSPVSSKRPSQGNMAAKLTRCIRQYQYIWDDLSFLPPKLCIDLTLTSPLVQSTKKNKRKRKELTAKTVSDPAYDRGFDTPCDKAIGKRKKHAVKNCAFGDES
ncbi:MAG: hypothetical protein J5828_03885 [Desulfovibrionaceae bacterium]|nr:hypothetical protein [Desulfovibrionaceae bacterium]